MPSLHHLLSLLAFGVLPALAAPSPLAAPQNSVASKSKSPPAQKPKPAGSSSGAGKGSPSPAGRGKAGEVYAANPGVGGTGKTHHDSAHFRIYDAPPEQAKQALAYLEGSFDCYVNVLKWRSSGISYHAKSDDQPIKYKMNVFTTPNLGNAAGVMSTDMKKGYSFIKVMTRFIADPTVVVHEYGHALTYHERTWVEQGQTGVWWEPVANWFAETYLNSDVCAASRKRHNTTIGNPVNTQQAVNKIMTEPWRTLVDGSPGSGNYYQSWPFLTYLTNNPDKIKGLGTDTMRQMFRRYKKGSNETPLHVVATLVGGQEAVGPIVGRYWARMAFADIGHKQLVTAYNQDKARIKYDHASGSGGTYTGKSNKAPKYMGANWIALTPTGGKMNISVRSESEFTAVVGVKSGGTIKYTMLKGGKGTVNAPAGSNVKLSIANTRSKLLMYDGFQVTSGPVSQGLKYTVKVTGVK